MPLTKVKRSEPEFKLRAFLHVMLFFSDVGDVYMKSCSRRSSTSDAVTSQTWLVNICMTIYINSLYASYMRCSVFGCAIYYDNILNFVGLIINYKASSADIGPFTQFSYFRMDICPKRLRFLRCFHFCLTIRAFWSYFVMAMNMAAKLGPVDFLLHTAHSYSGLSAWTKHL